MKIKSHKIFDKRIIKLTLLLLCFSLSILAVGPGGSRSNNNSGSTIGLGGPPGSLNEIPSSPFAAGDGSATISISDLISGNLFAAVPNYNANNISVYTVNQSTGEFTQIIGSPFSTGRNPAWLEYSPIASGNLFAATANTADDTVSVFSVNATTGVFSEVSGSPFLTGGGPYSIAFSPIASGNLFAVVSNTEDNNLSVYEVNQTTGYFTEVTSSPFFTGIVPYNATFSPIVLGNLYCASVNHIENSVSVFVVNQVTGMFNPVPGSPFSTGNGPYNVQFTPVINGKLYAAVVNLDNNNVSVYEVNQNTGQFVEITDSPFPAGSGANQIAFSPIVNGHLFASVVDFNDNNISVYEVDPNTGNLIQLSNSPFVTGGGPDGIAYTPLLPDGMFAATANFFDNNVYVYQVMLPLAPTITSISPSEGPQIGGTIITITGTNFSGTTEVNFGSTPATSFTVIDDNTIVATAPAGTGTVNITVTTKEGTSPITPQDQYTYLAPPTPLDLKGFTTQCRFVSQVDYINIITWKAPFDTTNIVEYRIYRDDFPQNLIGIIPKNGELEFVDHNRKKNVVYTYYVVSVDAFGDLSTPAVITIKTD